MELVLEITSPNPFYFILIFHNFIVQKSGYFIYMYFDKFVYMKTLHETNHHHNQSNKYSTQLQKYKTKQKSDLG